MPLIANAIKAHWGCFNGSDFNFDDEENTLDVTGEGNISGPIEDFAKNLAIAIWKVNKNKCEVTVNTVYMEELPTESFHFDESSYIEIMAKV
jgi:hypothetical protein